MVDVVSGVHALSGRDNLLAPGFALLTKCCGRRRRTPVVTVTPERSPECCPCLSKLSRLLSCRPRSPRSSAIWLGRKPWSPLAWRNSRPSTSATTRSRGCSATTTGCDARPARRVAGSSARDGTSVRRVRVLPVAGAGHDHDLRTDRDSRRTGFARGTGPGRSSAWRRDGWSASPERFLRSVRLWCRK